MLCNLVGLYGSGGSARHDWGQLRPKTTGRRVSAWALGWRLGWRSLGTVVLGWWHVLASTHSRSCLTLQAVEYYRKTYPERFSLHERLAAAENGTVFRVAFMPRAKLRAIVNLGEAVQECNKWVPPADTRFKETRCEILPDGTPDNFVDLLARFQNVHALVSKVGENGEVWVL